MRHATYTPGPSDGNDTTSDGKSSGNKHTKGPWEVRMKDLVYSTKGRFIADCECTPLSHRPSPPDAEDQANARLIASAPALLDGLKLAIEVLHTKGESGIARHLDEIIHHATSRQAGKG